MRYVHKNLSVLETKMIWEDNLSLAGGMQCCKAAVELGKKKPKPQGTGCWTALAWSSTEVRCDPWAQTYCNGADPRLADEPLCSP